MLQSFSVTVLGHRFHALLKVCSDRDDTAPLNVYLYVLIYMNIFNKY